MSGPEMETTSPTHKKRVPELTYMVVHRSMVQARELWMITVMIALMWRIINYFLYLDNVFIDLQINIIYSAQFTKRLIEFITFCIQQLKDNK